MLATGVSGSSYLVNDPGYTKTAYAFSEVRDSGIYRPKGRLTDPSEDLTGFRSEPLPEEFVSE